MDAALVICLVRELSGISCRCGKKKIAKQTFCYACYTKLPAHMRLALYRRIGEGYEDAYQSAVGMLGI